MKRCLETVHIHTYVCKYIESTKTKRRPWDWLRLKQRPSFMDSWILHLTEPLTHYISPTFLKLCVPSSSDITELVWWPSVYLQFLTITPESLLHLQYTSFGKSRIFYTYRSSCVTTIYLPVISVTTISSFLLVRHPLTFLSLWNSISPSFKSIYYRTSTHLSFWRFTTWTYKSTALTVRFTTSISY